MPNRTQYSGDSLESAQIRVLKLVVPYHRALAWIVNHPWPKTPGRVDRPHRLRIGQLRLKLHRLAGLDI